MRLIRVGNGPSAYLFPEQSDYSDNFGDLVQRTQRLPGFSGGFRTNGTEVSAKEIGSLRVGFWLIASNPAEMQALLDGVYRLQSIGLQRIYMRVFGDPNDTGIRWTEGEVSSINASQNVRNVPHRLQKIDLTIQCPDPYWNQLGSEAWKWGDGTLWGGGAVWGGSAAVYPLPALQNDIVETVAGNAATYPRIVISLPAGASASGFKLQRRNDSGVVLDEVSFADALTAGDVLIINARDMSVKLNGANAFTNAFNFARANFFRLEPAANRLRVSFDSVAGAPELRLRYYTRW